MTKKKQVDWRVLCVALACLTALEIYALSRGINGTILTIVVGIIAGVAGFTIPTPIKIKHN